MIDKVLGLKFHRLIFFISRQDLTFLIYMHIHTYTHIYIYIHTHTHIDRQILTNNAHNKSF